jgi:hypothetical protein
MRNVKLTNNTQNFISYEKFKAGDVAVYIKRNNQYISFETLSKLIQIDILKLTGSKVPLTSSHIPLYLKNLRENAVILSENPYNRQKLHRKDIEIVKFISNTKTNINKLREKVKNAEKAYKLAKMKSNALESASKKNRRPIVNNNNKPKPKRLKSK